MYFHLSFQGKFWINTSGVTLLQMERGLILQTYLFYQVSAVVHTHTV